MPPNMSKKEQKEKIEIDPGNTDSQGQSQSLQYTYWCFTYNNYHIEQIEHLEQVLRHECAWYIFQEEVGDSGTPHLQGTLKLKCKKRLTQLKRIEKEIHWEPTKYIKPSILYCTKIESRSGPVRAFGIEIPEHVRVPEPYGWQLEVMNIISTEPDTRTIHWFWEPTGNIGKTTLCKYLVSYKNALMVSGKSADMFHMIARFPNKRKIILVDCPRSLRDYINYGAIEQIKNGLIFSGKYEGAQLVFNCPHVIVFANQPPDLGKLSLDR